MTGLGVVREAVQIRRGLAAADPDACNAKLAPRVRTQPSSLKQRAGRRQDIRRVGSLARAYLAAGQTRADPKRSRLPPHRTTVPHIFAVDFSRISGVTLCNDLVRSADGRPVGAFIWDWPPALRRVKTGQENHEIQEALT